MIAPALPYGSSGEHAGFTGTLSIGQAALSHVLVELVRSSDFARVLFVSAHGGNAEPLAAAVRQLRSEGRAVWAWSPRWKGDAHAGRIETSLMLALAPDLVSVPPARPATSRRWPSCCRGCAPRACAPSARTACSATRRAPPREEGRELLAAAIADLRAFAGQLPTVSVAKSPLEASR